MSDRIAILPTPNPDAMKFTVPGRLVERGPYEYRRGENASDSPLAASLLALPGAQMVMVADRFVTVQRDEGHDWEPLGAAVIAALHAFLGSYQVAVFEPAPVAPADAPATTEVERRVVALLDEYVRPAVADDGGEIRFLGVEDGIVRISLRGACGTCPSSTTTLRMGVERLIREHVPEIRAVENVPLA